MSEIRNETLMYLEEHFPQILDYVPDDVLEFGIPNRIIMILATIYIGILFLISLGGNSLMIYLYIRHKSLRTPGVKLVINLAINNFIMHAKSWVFITNGIYGGPVLGEIGCISFAGFGTIAGLGEIWTITAIAYERCKAISTPLTKARKLKNSQITMIIAVIWMASILAALLPAFGVGGYVTDTYLLVCAFDTWNEQIGHRLYVYGLILFAWMIPLTIIMVCYGKIYSYTHDTRSKINVHRNSNESNSSSGRDSKKDPFKYRFKEYWQSGMFGVERKLASRLLIIIVIWICGWTPFAIFAFMQLIGYGHSVSQNVNLLAMLVCKSCSVINACLYGIRLPKFRRRIKALLSRILPNSLGLSTVETSSQAQLRRFELLRKHALPMSINSQGKSTLCHHRQDLNQSRTTGIRFQLEHNPIEPIIIHRAESQIVETEIKFQMKQAYVMKGGKKQLKNVLVISETESGKLKIGWSQRRSENTSNNTRRVSV